MSGWAVELKYKYVDGSWGVSQIWHASVPDKEEALRLVREYANVGTDVHLELKGEISDQVLQALKIPPDQARQWI